jgi:hypothetical protein
MTARAYYVDGVQLVNVGGELCESCEQRPGVGHSIGGSVICARCAGWAAREASEYAAEVEASRRRRADSQADDIIKVRQVYARLETNATSKSTTSKQHRERRQTNAAIANQKRSERARGVLTSALIGALTKLRSPQSSESLALYTGLSLPTVRRGLADLKHRNKINARKGRTGSTVFYSLRRVS